MKHHYNDNRRALNSDQSKHALLPRKKLYIEQSERVVKNIGMDRENNKSTNFPMSNCRVWNETNNVQGS